VQDFDLSIESGLANPGVAPYTYEGFSFELLSKEGYAIDGKIST
jgi:hypothetical protein